MTARDDSTSVSTSDASPQKASKDARHVYQTVDWACRTEHFAFLCEKAGWTPSVDVCCDSIGSNKLCEEFIGEDEDVCSVDLTGRRIWCNPPYDTPTVCSVLRHVMSHDDVKALILLP